jgi:hypothetical protein
MYRFQNSAVVCLSITITYTILQSYITAASSAKQSATHPECRLYLAQSTIPNAGLGIFTGIPLQPNQSIAEPDLIVPITDVQWNAAQDLDFHFLWTDYSWMTSEVGMETDMHDGSALVIGTGCMPNCNYALINAYEGKVSLLLLRFCVLVCAMKLNGYIFKQFYTAKLQSCQSTPIERSRSLWLYRFSQSENDHT